jgi:hypothetical protein
LLLVGKEVCCIHVAPPFVDTYTAPPSAAAICTDASLDKSMLDHLWLLLGNTGEEALLQVAPPLVEVYTRPPASVATNVTPSSDIVTLL